jgi:predicted transglutaminase-like protease
MLRKLLKKFGLKSNIGKSEEYIEKTSLENSLQPMNKDQEITKDKQLDNANIYVYSSQSELKMKKSLNSASLFV